MTQTILSWLYLFGAAVCQMVWAYSLKYIEWNALKTLHWNTFYRSNGGLPILLPWIVYVAFGLSSTLMLAGAMRTISTTTAFAVWMAVSLVLIKAADIFWLKLSWSWSELFFILLITIGIIGLKLVGPAE